MRGNHSSKGGILGMKQFVSIIITCYNYGHFLDECIRSALEQTYEAIEVIVVNDGSTDETEDICRRFEGKILYHSQPNMGVVEAVNAGIRMSKGHFFYFLSADDKLFPDTVRKQIEIMQHDDTCAVVCGNGKLIDAQGKEIGDSCIPLPNKYLLIKMLETPNLHDGSLLFRRACLEKINGLFFGPYENYHGFHHRCFQLARDFTIRYINEFLVYQRVHTENLSNAKNMAKMITGYEILRKKMRDYVQPADLFEGLDVNDRNKMAEAFVKLATFYFFFGQYDLSFADLQQAVDLSSDILDHAVSIPEMTLERYLYPFGKYDEAGINPSLAQSFECKKDQDAYGIIDTMKKGNLLKAFYQCRKILEKNPDRSDIKFILSQIFVRQPQIHDSVNRTHRITIDFLKQIQEKYPLHSMDLYLWLAYLDEDFMPLHSEKLEGIKGSIRFFDLGACLWLIKIAIANRKEEFLKRTLSVIKELGLNINFNTPQNTAPKKQVNVYDGKRKLRILFISPPYARIMGLGNGRIPLSFGSMATILARNGHTVGIYDSDFDRKLIGRVGNHEYTFTHQHLIAQALNDNSYPLWKEIERQVTDFNPDVVGISAMTTKYPTAAKITSIVKSVNPAIKVVIGGHHPSIFGEQLLGDNSIDFSVKGEGEITMLELANRLCEERPDFSNIHGLIYKDGNRIVTSPPRKLLRDLDALPITDRDLMINADYVSENNLMTSRGCPYSCHYCGAQIIWQHKVRRRSVGHVMKEIDYLFSRTRSRNISFWDDSFTMSKKYTLEMMSALKRYPGMTFSCITRLDLIDGEILLNLKQAGCILINFGIESGSEKMLRSMNKKMTKDFIKKQIDLVRKYEIPWLGFFIMGYPGETREEMNQTLEFMKELDPYYAEINVFNPLPGTKIWDDLSAANEVNYNLDFSRFSQSSLNNYFLKDIPQDEFKNLASTMIKEFDQHNREKGSGVA